MRTKWAKTQQPLNTIRIQQGLVVLSLTAKREKPFLSLSLRDLRQSSLFLCWSPPVRTPDNCLPQTPHGESGGLTALLSVEGRELCRTLAKGVRTSFCFIWRIIALQCCVGFCHTMMQISHIYVYIYPLPPEPPPTPAIPPLQVITGGQAGLLMLYSSFSLTRLHMAGYTYQCYSLNLSHPLLPPLYPEVCDLSLFLTDSFISTIFLDSICIH